MHFTTITAISVFIGISTAVSCGGFSTANVNDAKTCADLLRGKGSQTCATLGTSAPEMCHQGTARVYGVSTNGQAQITSCENVAEALDRIINQCSLNGQVSGSELTSANPGLRIELHH